MWELFSIGHCTFLVAIQFATKNCKLALSVKLGIHAPQWARYIGQIVLTEQRRNIDDLPMLELTSEAVSAADSPMRVSH